MTEVQKKAKGTDGRKREKLRKRLFNRWQAQSGKANTSK